jgi:hypothetical protein
MATFAPYAKNIPAADLRSRAVPALVKKKLQYAEFSRNIG